MPQKLSRLSFEERRKLKALRRQQKKIEESLPQLKEDQKKLLIEAQMISVGFDLSDLPTREKSRQFTKTEIIEILKQYNAIGRTKIRGAKLAWLKANKLTTAHISVWKKKLKSGALLDSIKIPE